jgi:hypothetical protein
VRINIKDFIKIFTVFVLIKISENENIELKVSLATVAIAVTDWHIYDI